MSQRGTDMAFLFPGQGAQYVGMGADLHRRFPEVRATFREAEAALGFSLERLCFEGPAGELQQTENCQPAILTLSVAIARLLEGAGLRPWAVAGHSVGEYAALVCAGALSFPDACRVVRARGRLMAEAGDRAPGGMLAINGLPAPVVEALCWELGRRVADVASYNSGDQAVVSGPRESIRMLGERALARGALRVTVLPVSAAFHSRLMEPARGPFAKCLEQVRVVSPRIPVVFNLRGAPAEDPDEIRRCLVEQLVSPVRWTACMGWLLEHGAGQFVEVGPGKTLTAFARSVARDTGATALSTGTAQGVQLAMDRSYSDERLQLVRP